MIQLKLSKVWHCKPSEVLKEPTDIVIAALQYEKFINDYESTAYMMAKEASK